MQRLLSLGLLVIIVGGGWSLLQGITAQDVGRAAQKVQQRVAQATFATAAPQQPVQYSAPSAFSSASAPSAQPTIRIASFNIQTFGKSKMGKPYVMRTIAEVIRRFDVVAIQEIRTQDDYFVQNLLRDYVNPGASAPYAATVSPRLGRTISTEQYAYVYNTATVEASPQVDFVLTDNQDALHREPHVAMFRTRVAPVERAFTFVLMNVHTDPDEVKDELDALYGAYQAVQRMSIHGATEDDVILLGDLNTNVPAAGPYTPSNNVRDLTPSDLRMLSRIHGIYPLIRNQATNTRGTRLHDNLLIPRITTTEFTGRSGVFDLPGEFRLSREQALQVSDHLPVWGEFSAYESTRLGPVALRP